MRCCIVCVFTGYVAPFFPPWVRRSAANTIQQVEAMSKHFLGDGIPFEPFSYKRILEEDDS